MATRAAARRARRRSTRVPQRRHRSSATPADPTGCVPAACRRSCRSAAAACSGGSIPVGQPDHPQRVGDDADRRAQVVTGEEAQLGAVRSCRSRRVALVEQCLAEQAPGRRSAVGRPPPRPSRGRVRSGPGGRRRRPRVRGEELPTIPSWNRPLRSPTSGRPGQAARLGPTLAAAAATALHLQVGVQRPPGVGVGSAVDPGEQVLAPRGGLDDGAAGGRRWRAGAGSPVWTRVCPSSAFASRWAVRRTHIALRHRSRPQALRGHEAGCLERLAQGSTRAEQGSPVGLLDRHPPSDPRRSPRPRAGCGQVRSTSSDQVTACGAPLDVHHQHAVDGTIRAPALRPGRWPMPVSGRSGPARAARSAMRLAGSVAASATGRACVRVALEGAQGGRPPGGAELGGTEAGDEVATPAAAGLLERREHLDRPREPAGTRSLTTRTRSPPRAGRGARRPVRARRVGSVSRAGSGAQRPAVSGGPVRAGPAPGRRPAAAAAAGCGGRRCRWVSERAQRRERCRC